MTQGRTEDGKFAPKSDTPRYVRTIRLTETTWEKVGHAADKLRITRADLVEQLAEDGLFDGGFVSAEHDQLITQVEGAIQLVLNDSVVTRGGKDRGAVKRGLEALLKQLKSV